MLSDKDENNLRVIYRPTKEQYNRLIRVLNKSQRYKHLSELLRHAVDEGLNKIEGEIKRVEKKYR